MFLFLFLFFFFSPFLHEWLKLYILLLKMLLSYFNAMQSIEFLHVKFLLKDFSIFFLFFFNFILFYFIFLSEWVRRGFTSETLAMSEVLVIRTLRHLNIFRRQVINFWYYHCILKLRKCLCVKQEWIWKNSSSLKTVKYVAVIYFFLCYQSKLLNFLT